MPIPPVTTYTTLAPLSWLYGAGVVLRNRLFDLGWLQSAQFDLPIISVGNIAVGGTGKTPHVEYLIQLLHHQFHVAILSRGYKRKTKGFLLATPHSTAADIGDEPLQMSRKFPHITVAVDGNRREGICHLMTKESFDVILLDDAFQHRYVKPGLSILLTDYNRLFTRDRLMPAGRLREPVSGRHRADIVIVTKCPFSLTNEEAEDIRAELQLEDRQSLFFSGIGYAGLQSFGSSQLLPLDSLTPQHHVLLLTGIATPAPIIQELKQHTHHITSMAFGDHHTYTATDLQRVADSFNQLPPPKLLVTTEKDAARLMDTDRIPATLLPHCYTLPIQMRILLGKANQFNQIIIQYVRENTRNGILAEGKDDHPSPDSHRAGNRSGTVGC